MHELSNKDYYIQKLHGCLIISVSGTLRAPHFQQLVQTQQSPENRKKATNDMIHQVKRHIVVFMLVPGLTVVSVQVSNSFEV